MSWRVHLVANATNPSRRSASSAAGAVHGRAQRIEEHATWATRSLPPSLPQVAHPVNYVSICLNYQDGSACATCASSERSGDLPSRIRGDRPVETGPTRSACATCVSSKRSGDLPSRIRGDLARIRGDRPVETGPTDRGPGSQTPATEGQQRREQSLGYRLGGFAGIDGEGFDLFQVAEPGPLAFGELAGAGLDEVDGFW